MSVDGWLANDLGRLADAATMLQPLGHRWWFIDEITSVSDGWPHRIKWLRDNDSRFGDDTVVLTGSSATDLGTAAGTLLGRRGDAASPDRVLLPMGFRTFAGLRAQSRDESRPRWKRATRTLADSPWRGIVATRSVLDLEDPDLLAVPAAQLAWLIDT